MATRVFQHSRGVQDSNPEQVWRAYERILQFEYPGVEEQVGAQFWGTGDLETTGLHNEVLYHTGLLGTAVALGRDNRTAVPMATYETQDQVVADYSIIGIGFEYYPDELEDFLYDEIVLDKLGDLPILLADGEEREHFTVYNNGETQTGGWTGEELFNNNLRILADGTSVSYGSNIVTTAGGPSFHLISLVDQYGMNFINEEGRVSPLRVERVMCSPQNAKLLSLYYGATMNIESGSNPNSVPVRAFMGEDSPAIIPTHRLSNANDMIFFYEGWEQDMKERNKYRGQTMTEEIGDLNEKRVVSIIRSRFAYYWHSNRRVLLVQGAA